jgi:hypothetical protein
MPRKKGMSTGATLLVVFGAMVLLCCGIGTIGAMVSGGSSDTASSTSDSGPVAADPTTTKPAPPPTTAAAPATTKPAPSGKDAAALAVVAWWEGGAKDRMNVLNNDFTAIATASSNNNVLGVGAGCLSMQKHVEAAQAYRSVPDAQGQTYWAAAMASYARAAGDCIAGIESGNQVVMQRGAQEIQDGNLQIEKLTGRIRELGGI